MKTTWGAVFFILELCLHSALAIEVLPQIEMRELDIFMQDEEYMQITREKRTEENIQEEEESSGDGLLPIPEIVFRTEQDENESKQENITNETPPSSPDSNFQIPIDPRVDTVDSGSETKTELQAGVTESTDSEVQSTTVSSSDLPPIPEESNNVHAIDQSNDTSGVISADTTDNTELSPPDIGIRTGLSKDNTSESETTQGTTPASPPEIGRAVISPNSAGSDGTQDPTLSSNTSTNVNTSGIAGNDDTLKDAQNSTDSPPPNVLPDQSVNTTDNNASANTNTAGNTGVRDNSEISKNISTYTNSTDVSPTKPVIAESDKTQQGSVSGSGILLTIIILVIVAGLAGLGYVIYKKRAGGYTPVNVDDDQGKEMNEIENGFGKPIRADEVRIQDQLTPVQPLATPRSFMTPPTERKQSDMDVIKSNNDRHTQEESIEIEEEDKKKADE